MITCYHWGRSAIKLETRLGCCKCQSNFMITVTLGIELKVVQIGLQLWSCYTKSNPYKKRYTVLMISPHLISNVVSTQSSQIKEYPLAVWSVIVQLFFLSLREPSLTFGAVPTVHDLECLKAHLTCLQTIGRRTGSDPVVLSHDAIDFIKGHKMINDRI